jgi:hypothetical protein
MYRIYMPVDLVIAITHSKMRKHNDNRCHDVKVVIPENREICENREKIDNYDNIKQSRCLDVFRLW